MKNKDKNKKVVAPGDVGVTTNIHQSGYEKAFLHLGTLQKKRGNKTICISL